ncbi:MAG TPA: hypothetical protein VGF04_10750, partial [Solirubrobacterales bacterium]
MDQLREPDLLDERCGSDPFRPRRERAPDLWFDCERGDFRSLFLFTSPSSIVPRQPPSASSSISAKALNLW